MAKRYTKFDIRESGELQSEDKPHLIQNQNNENSTIHPANPHNQRKFNFIPISISKKFYSPFQYYDENDYDKRHLRLKVLKN